MVKIKKVIYLLVGLLAVVLFLLLLSFREQHQGNKLKVVFCDVGQGDAELIRTPAGQDILVDGGPDNKVLECLGKYLPFYDKKIELVVLTHPHADHLVGLVSVLQRYAVDEVLLTGVNSREKSYADFLKIIQDKKIKTVRVLAGDNFVLDKGLTMEILWPAFDLSGRETKDLNDSSIIFKLTYQNASFLFTGDAGGKIEEILVGEQAGLSAQVLKIGHHGSSLSSGAGFLAAVKPDIAVISVGAGNKFGHPSLRVVRRLEQRGVKVWRTDQNGDVILTSDGQKIERGK